jgi:ELWxxDGT repeat protein
MIGTAPGSMAVVGGRAFFVSGTELWSTDGTAPGTMLIKDLGTSNSGFDPEFAVAGTQLFFVASDGTHGFEPWRSDGTAAGTGMVKDIVPGSSSGLNEVFARIVAAGSRVYFVATDQQLWTSDGTEAGTIPLTQGADITEIGALSSLGGQVFFTRTQSIAGHNTIWRTDGTVAGTAALPART